MGVSSADDAHIPSVLEDPGQQAVSRVYAEAFLQAQAADRRRGALEEFRSFVVDVVEKNPGFARMLMGRELKREQKLDVINRVLSKGGSEGFVNFLRVLARHDRLDLIPTILRGAESIFEKASGFSRVRIRTAKPLSDESRALLKTKLKEYLTAEPIIQEIVDPDILGGVEIRVGDTVYDGSLRTRLKNLRERLREKTFHEIQSRRDRFSHPEGD